MSPENIMISPAIFYSATFNQGIKNLEQHDYSAYCTNELFVHCC